MFDAPGSSVLPRISPTGYEVLRGCRLRMAFGQRHAGASFHRTPAMRLGDVCHHVLDDAVRTRALLSPEWKEEVRLLWETYAEAEEQSAEAEGAHEPVARWPGYQLKRARLFQVAGRVRELIAALPEDAEVLTEAPLSAFEGRLFGRADLVIRGETVRRLIDYKSGSVIDRESLEPRESYVRQLQLYAFLERESSGAWPTSAHLLPLHGPPVEIAIDAATCTAVAADAIASLEMFNAAAPGEQPASPARATCGYCQYAAGCYAFWSVCDGSWAPDVLAASGRVERAFTTPLGGVSLRLAVEKGSLEADAITVSGIDPALHPAALAADVGSELAAVRLVLAGADGYRLPSWGVIDVLPQEGG